MMAQNLATTQKEAKKQAGIDKDNLVLSSTAHLHDSFSERTPDVPPHRPRPEETA
jgi:hypothetical protein